MKDAFDSSRYYRVKQVVDTLSVSRSTIYHWIKKEEFPAPKKFGPALSAWFGYELNEWCCRKNSEARNQQKGGRYGGFEKERPTVAAVGLILQGLIVPSLIYQI